MSKKDDEAASKHLLIRLVTKQPEYALPSDPLNIPASISIPELNILINDLLKQSNASHQKTDFDILISSEFLRGPLIEHVQEKSISEEDVIEVEYLVQQSPPEPQDCLLHDDWVSAVAVRGNWILTGCYDNTLHIWTAQGKHHLTIPGHTEAVKAVSWVSLQEDSASFVSASQDQTTILWNWNIPRNSVESVYVCRGHERSLEAVGVNDAGSFMVTGSWDAMLKLWSASTSDEDDANEDGASKAKRARSDGAKVRVPKRTMKGHKDAISGAVWTDRVEVVTSSWDHTLKLWDTELGGIKHEIIGNKSFFDVDYSQRNGTLVTASADCYVRLYDPRAKDGAIVRATYASHRQWIKCVKWSTTDEHLFLSGGYDNLVKLWDTRTTKAALFDLSGHEDKVLCCDWSDPKLMVSGSADNTVRTYKA